VLPSRARTRRPLAWALVGAGGYWLYLSGLFAFIRSHRAFYWLPARDIAIDALPHARHKAAVETAVRNVNIDPTESLSEQYLEFMAAALTGDWGHSFWYAEPTTTLLWPVLPWAGGLLVAAVLLAIASRPLLTSIVGSRPSRIPDRVALSLLYAGWFLALVRTLAAPPRLPAWLPASPGLLRTVLRGGQHHSLGRYLYIMWVNEDGGLLLGVGALLGLVFLAGLAALAVLTGRFEDALWPGRDAPTGLDRG